MILKLFCDRCQDEEASVALPAPYFGNPTMYPVPVPENWAFITMSGTDPSVNHPYFYLCGACAAATEVFITGKSVIR